MSRKKQISARDSLRAECTRYLTHLYDSEAKEKYAQFRKRVSDELEVKQKTLKKTVEENNKRKAEFQEDTTENMKFIAKLESFLKEKDDVQLVKNCIQADYLPEWSELDIDFNLCGCNLTYVITKQNADKILALRDLLECLDNNNDEPQDQILAFHRKFNKYVPLFKEAKDSRGNVFCEVIFHILASLFTGLVYLGARVIHSYHSKNSFAFWRSRNELLNGEVKNAVGTLPATPYNIS